MKQDLEIVSLNADELDIEELERRLELALGAPITPDAWICGNDCGSQCGVHCDTQCACDGFVPCGAANCGGNCASYDPDPCPRYGSCNGYHIP